MHAYKTSQSRAIVHPHSWTSTKHAQSSHHIYKASEERVQYTPSRLSHSELGFYRGASTFEARTSLKSQRRSVKPSRPTRLRSKASSKYKVRRTPSGTTGKSAISFPRAFHLRQVCHWQLIGIRSHFEASVHNPHGK